MAAYFVGHHEAQPPDGRETASGRTHNDFLVDDVAAQVIVLREPVRDDTHDDDGRDPDKGVGGQEKG